MGDSLAAVEITGFGDADEADDCSRSFRVFTLDSKISLSFSGV